MLYLNIYPKELLIGLIQYQIGETEAMTANAQEARKVLEESLDDNSIGHMSWSRLMVCYALEGNREQMEVAKARAQEIEQNAIKKE